MADRHGVTVYSSIEAALSEAIAFVKRVRERAAATASEADMDNLYDSTDKERAEGDEGYAHDDADHDGSSIASFVEHSPAHIAHAADAFEL
ncbi:MAG: hypothetical protein EOO65_00725, partial [Methanosarcinales archaeon]